jgi:hypothetical protein
LTEEVVEQGEVFRGRRVAKGSYLPLFLIFILLLDAAYQRFGLGGRFLPLRPHDRLGGVPSPPPLPLFPQSFIIDTVGIPPHRILV